MCKCKGKVFFKANQKIHKKYLAKMKKAFSYKVTKGFLKL